MEYKVQNYINKKIEEINNGIPIVKSYEFGYAVGMFHVYKCLKFRNEHIANDIFKKLKEHECGGVILKELIELEDEKPETDVERMKEKLYEEKRFANRDDC